MRVGGHLTRALCWLRPLWMLVCLSGSALAQDSTPQVSAQTGPSAVNPTSVILTLDQDRLFAGSDFGKASLERERVASRALEAENARIEAELIAEEQDLTLRRATLSTDEFATLATAFDEKVERIRTEQDAKAREVARVRDEERQVFLRAVVPVLGELLTEKGAVAIFDKSTIILSLTAIDATELAIARVNAALSAGSGAPDPAP